MTKKSPFLKELQEYLREGTRTLTKLEQWLVGAEDHIKKLEKSEDKQEILIANETIKKLTAKIKELEKNPHTALNKSEKKIEEILHKIAIIEDYQIGTYIKVLAQLENWTKAGNTEQNNAFVKYEKKIDKSRLFLLDRQRQYKEKLEPNKTARKPDHPWSEILGEGFFDKE